MPKSLIRASFGTLRWALCAAGAIALLITALIATPLVRPPELASISAARGTVDFSALLQSSGFRRGTARCWVSATIPRAASPRGARPS